jgi:RES domain-containing protein
MRVFRIALKKYGATAKDAFNGKSGYSADGRWHTRGRYLDYAAGSRSLATLERLVHYKRFNFLEPHMIYELEIPGEHIEAALTAPPGWDQDDLLASAQAIGNEWCDKVRCPGLQVPSAVTRGEYNLMLNSRHSAWDWRWVVSSGPFDFDNRLADLLKK